MGYFSPRTQYEGQYSSNAVRTTIECKVNCMASRHTIILKNGALALPDHPDGFEEIEVLKILEPNVRCRCQEVLFWWNWYVQDLSPAQVLSQAGIETGDNSYRNLREVYGALPFVEETIGHRVSYYDEVQDSLLLSLIPKALRDDAQHCRYVRSNRNRRRSMARMPVSPSAEERPKFMRDPRMLNFGRRKDTLKNRYSSQWRKKEALAELANNKVRNILYRYSGNTYKQIHSRNFSIENPLAWLRMLKIFSNEGSWVRQCFAEGFVPLKLPIPQIWPEDFPPCAQGVWLRRGYEDEWSFHDFAWATLSRQGEWGSPITVRVSFLSHP